MVNSVSYHHHVSEIFIEILSEIENLVVTCEHNGLVFPTFLFISSDVFLHIIDDCCDKTVYFELFLNSRKLSASNSSTSILQLTASLG